MLQPRLNQDRANYSGIVLLKANDRGVGLYIVDFPSLIVSVVALCKDWEQASKQSEKFSGATVYVDCENKGYFWLGQKVHIPALGLIN